MKKQFIRMAFACSLMSLLVFMACEDDAESCTGCADDAPYGALGGGCYSTLSACESAESGNCVICQ